MKGLVRMTGGLVRRARQSRWLNGTARGESRVDRHGGHPVGDPRAHLDEALEWLCRAQDSSADDGFARGYSVAWNPHFGARGWQPSYPETTGYIIPTLLEASVELDRPDLGQRALRAAGWEIELQLENGAVQGGVVGQGRTPAVFNTGQVMLGWLAALEDRSDPRYAWATRRAGEWLVSVQERDGLWRKGNSQFALAGPTLYNARVAWALAEAGVSLGEGEFLDAARRNLRAVARRVASNGWIPDCCLTDPVRPLLHTLAYAVRGLVEGGRVLSDDEILGAGIRTARALADRVREDGWMGGRYDSSWEPAVEWSCLTGSLQMCNNWMRLSLITGDAGWLDPVDPVLRFVEATQNRTSSDPGLRGGIKGSWPIDGDYGRYEVLNWATKYLVDGLIRRRQIADGRGARPGAPSRLA